MPWLTLRTVALAVALVAAAFWLWFGIASAFAERGGVFAGVLHTLVPGGLLLMTALAAWKWEAFGGALLLVEGLVVAVGYPLAFGRRFPIATTLLMLATLALPLVASGIMLLVDSRRCVARG